MSATENCRLSNLTVLGTEVKQSKYTKNKFMAKIDIKIKYLRLLNEK